MVLCCVYVSVDMSFNLCSIVVTRVLFGCRSVKLRWWCFADASDHVTLVTVFYFWGFTFGSFVQRQVYPPSKKWLGVKHGYAVHCPGFISHLTLWDSAGVFLVQLKMHWHFVGEEGWKKVVTRKGKEKALRVGDWKSYRSMLFMGTNIMIAWLWIAVLAEGHLNPWL